MHSRSRCAAAIAVSAALAVTSVAAPADAKPKSSTKTTKLAPGVTLTQSVFQFTGTQRMFTLRINLDGHNRLVAAAPGNVVGAARQTTLTIGRQQRAIAGVNGDTFYFFDKAAVPRGGFSTNGLLMKSALKGKNAVLYTTASGRAYVGNPGWITTVNTVDARGKYRSKTLGAVNSIENARNGALALLDHRVLSSSLTKRPQKKRACTVVRLADLGGNKYRVGRVGRAKSYSRVPVGQHALLTCGAEPTSWVRSALRPGQTVTAAARYRVRGIVTLLSGNKQLIRNGKRYNDRTGLSVYGNEKKPETFGCVLRGNRTVLLGVVEGDRKGRAGMTYATLTSYLLKRKCTSAIVFDGSGSSTLVAKRPGGKLKTMNKVTAPGGMRKVVNGLYVVRR